MGLAEVDNSRKAIETAFTQLCDDHQCQAGQVLVCIENTGHYSAMVSYLLHQLGFAVWVEDALHLKQSMGRVKGKTDRVDAYRVCKYAVRNVNDYQAFTPPTDAMAELQSLEGQRKRLIKARNIIAVPLAEESRALPQDLSRVHQYGLDTVRQINEQLKVLDKEILRLIRRDPRFKRNYDITTSIPGLGTVIARRLIMATNNFTTTLDARKLASHLGVAPFERQSGKCLNKKPTTGSGGKKTLKGMLFMGMLSITKSDNKLGRYYHRKIAQGKPHHVAMNNLINKVLHIVVACVRNDVLYNEKYANPLA